MKVEHKRLRSDSYVLLVSLYCSNICSSCSYFLSLAGPYFIMCFTDFFSAKIIVTIMMMMTMIVAPDCALSL